MINKKLISVIVFAFVTIYSSMLMAEQNKIRGKVLKVDGEVEIVDEKGDNRVVTNIDEPLHEMDTIVTREGARVVLQFDDGALSVLDEKSRLRVEKTSWFSYLGGKVYFTFKKVFGETRHVKTRAATIGIRGTTFIISENSEQNGESVALKEGLLQIQSTGPAFEIHKQRNLDEFEQYKQERLRSQAALQDEFDRYKQQAMDEFVEYRRNFTLQPNRVISLSGYRINETAMSADNEKDFVAFESEAEELIKNFRDKVEKVKKEKAKNQADDSLDNL
jgi:hypothetical protein